MAHPSQSLPVLGHAEATAIVGEPVYTVTPIGQGQRSRVYRVETEEGGVRIVRITPKGQGRVEREAWVRSKFRKHPDVPLPAEIVAHEPSLSRVADIVTMSELPGASMFAATRTMFEPEVRALYAQFGAGIGALHAVEVAGFGLLDGAGKGAFATWAEFLAALARASLEEARVSPLGSLVPRAEAVINELSPAASTAVTTPRLTHGDAQPLNVHVHRGKIVAFLDFEFASGSDPRYELASIESLFEPSPAVNATPEDLALRRDAFYEGYARHRPERDAGDASTFRLYRLLHALRGTEFLSVVGPQLAAPVRDQATRAMQAGVERWLAP